MKAASTPSRTAARKAVARKAPASKSTVATAKTAQPTKPAATKTEAIARKATAEKPVAVKESNAVVRDSFTMTSEDHELLKVCKRDAVAAGRDSTKKSEIVRAALKHFAQLPAAARLVELNNLWPIKTGRPNKKK
jgi:hypothetical protein